MLDSLKLAIVDVETTGGSAIYNRIIEIAVLRVEEGKLVRTYESLVNPECAIPPIITQLTGIGDIDVEDAPKFRSIAADVREAMDGCIFVAHNARFDQAFVRNELERLGMPWSAKCLCTVRLSRRLYPQHRRHNLSALIERFGFACENRHRALDDAQAVWSFLQHARATIEEDRFASALQHLLKTQTLPPNLAPSVADRLPSCPGVYVFRDATGMPVYVGKSRNIRQRVLSHFSGDHSSGREMRLCQATTRVETFPTYGEIGALFLESHLVKSLMPIYNRQLRHASRLVVLRKVEQPDGYHAVAIERLDTENELAPGEILALFRSQRQAKAFLAEAAQTARLCPRRLGLESGSGACFAYHLKRCDGACTGKVEPALYNARLSGVFESRRLRTWPYPGPVLIEEKGNDSSGHLFIARDWRLLHAFAYSEDGIKPFLPSSYRFDYDSYRILLRPLMAGGREVKPLSEAQLQQLLQQAGVEADAADLAAN